MNEIKRLFGRFKVGLILIRNIKNWLPVFLNYAGIRKDNCIIHKLKDGQIIKLKRAEKIGETSGLASIYEIFFMKNYNPKGMEIKEDDTIIDIGANIGIFTIYAAFLAKSGVIYSYEPFKTHFSRLLENIKLNKIHNVKAFNQAVGGSRGKRNLNISNISSGMHSFFFKGSGEKTSVECTTLKDIFDSNKIKRCDFLKIDCEGAEYEILYNLPTKYFKRLNKIALEWDNLDNKKSNIRYLRNFLGAKGFKVKVKGEGQTAGILYAKRV